jgi:hypothetical protein
VLALTRWRRPKERGGVQVSVATFLPKHPSASREVFVVLAEPWAQEAEPVKVTIEPRSDQRH